MKFALIDDLPQYREELRTQLERFIDKHYAGERSQIDEFDSGSSFIKSFRPGQYDILFIDQYMDDLSGLETAAKIRETDTYVAIIFVTTSREHALDSYSVRACGYLVKPYSFEELETTLKLANIIKIRNGRFITIDEEKILLREIIWCDRDGHYVRIHTDLRGVLRLRLSFMELERLLSVYPQFLSCYRGCMINMDRTTGINELSFSMDNGETVDFRKRDRKTIEKQYYQYLFQRIREDQLI